MLQSSQALSSCLARVRRALAGDGMFVLDLMTRRGFWQDYNGVWVADTENELYVFKSVYDGAEKAAARANGIRPRQRSPGAVRRVPHADALPRTGRHRGTAWNLVWIASIDDLRSPVADPEQFDRIFFVAQITAPPPGTGKGILPR